MSRYYGKIGYGAAREVGPGVFEDVIEERSYYGDVTRNARTLTEGEQVLDDISVGNNISIVADAYAYEHFFEMKYIEWAGTLWKISTVEVQRPRLLLTLGGVYNGPTPS